MSLDYCVVFGCKNSITNPARRKIDCILFNFPLNQQDLTDKWLRRLNLEGWIPGPESLVCEEHFSLDSFEIVDNKRVLQPNAVPSIVDELDRILLHYEILLNSQNKSVLHDVSSDEEFRCRICAAFISSQEAVNVYSDDEKIALKILTCIPIVMKTFDYLPKYICRMCLSDLNTSYRMLMRAIESEKFFNNLLINEQKSNNDVIAVDETRPNCEESFGLFDSQCNLQYDEVNRQDVFTQRSDNSAFDFVENDLLEPMHELDGGVEKTVPMLAVVAVENSDDSDSKDRADDKKCNSCNASFTDSAAIDNFHGKLSSQPEKHTSESLEQMSEMNDCPLFTCHYCSTSYEKEEELSKHLEEHVVSVWCDDTVIKEKHTDTENASLATNICKVCFIVFPSSGTLEYHLKLVHNLKYFKNYTCPKYTCNECGKEFKNKITLTNHERIHTGVRPFVCENCGSSFKSRATLNQHLVIHTGEKKYKCAVCSKAFARKAFVDAHMRVHTKERPFQCNICEKQYTQVGDLRRHLQRCQRPALSEKKTETQKNYCEKSRGVRSIPVNASRSSASEGVSTVLQ